MDSQILIVLHCVQIDPWMETGVTVDRVLFRSTIRFLIILDRRWFSSHSWQISQRTQRNNCFNYLGIILCKRIEPCSPTGLCYQLRTSEDGRTDWQLKSTVSRVKMEGESTIPWGAPGLLLNLSGVLCTATPVVRDSSHNWDGNPWASDNLH